MKRLLRDVGILWMLCTITWGVMQIRGGKNRRVELNRGEMYYSPRVSFAAAQDLSTYMVRAGAFSGRPTTMMLDRDDGIYQLKMVVIPELLDLPGARRQAEQFGRRVCQEFFNGKSAAVHLANDQLQSFELLVPATQ